MIDKSTNCYGSTEEEVRNYILGEPGEASQKSWVIKIVGPRQAERKKMGQERSVGEE